MKRRDFFKLAGISTTALIVGATLPGCDSPHTTPSVDNSDADDALVSVDIPVNFTEEADVLIIGSGITGLSAAMDPSEAGRSVIIADMLDLIGGESFAANGLVYTSGTDIQKNAGITTNLDDAWAELEEELKKRGLTQELDFEKTLFEKGSEWVNRISADYGSQFEDPQEYVSKGSPGTFLIPKAGLGDMTSIMTPMRDKLLSQGVSYMLGMRASIFILDENSVPVGMRFYLDKTNTVTDIKARAIVFATGGFVCNQEFVKNYLPEQAKLPCYTTYANGEGHRLATTIQGQLKAMDEAARPTSDLPQVDVWGLFGPVLNISLNGQRIAAEDRPGAAAQACADQELGFWWTVFDNQISDNGFSKSVSYITGQAPKRVLGPFATLEDMATALSISAEALKTTFSDYQKAVAAGKDADFGKTLFLETLKAPYYAVKQFPYRFRSFGGILTNESGQLLDGFGTIIPHVYACGACAAGSYAGLSSHAAYGTIVGQAIVEALDDEDAAEDAAEDAESASDGETSK